METMKNEYTKILNAQQQQAEKGDSAVVTQIGLLNEIQRKYADEVS